jgi:transposase
VRNRPAHKVDGVRTLIEVASASLLYLPPCSPDLNPIEMAFAILEAISAFNAQECANYFKHA